MGEAVEGYLNGHDFQATQQKKEEKKKVLEQFRNRLLKNEMNLLIHLEVGNAQCNKKGAFGHILKDNNC